MCTIVFIPTTKDGFVLAHNRDESPTRKRALPPQNVAINDVSVLAPIDGSKQGTWIFSNNKRTVLLFNGALVKHQHRPPYNRSRGKIVFEVLDFDNHDQFLEDVDLTGVEPFTQILINHKQMKIDELVWDGHEKLHTVLAWSPFIRSSSTLYNAEVKKIKEAQFRNWLNENRAEDVMQFMQNKDFEVPIILESSLVKTISTTLVNYENGATTMRYFDYLSETEAV